MASFSIKIAKITRRIVSCRVDCANSMPTGKLISGVVADETINTIVSEGISSLLAVEERGSSMVQGDNKI